MPHESVLRDHALSYLLAGIAAVPELAQGVVFKGGTALRKCYFAGYRYSEDLDFSSRDLRDWTTSAMTALHGAMRDLLAGADARDRGRTVPVRFGSGDPHPTRLLDVLGWLSDHYVEHTGQVASLLADWQTLAVHEAIDRALAAGDVDAYLACLAEDIVFENTTPAPDGERMVGPAVGAFFKQFFVSTPKRPLHY
jgi:hypothetical protein